MEDTIEKALFDIKKVDSLMRAFEETYLDVMGQAKDRARADSGQYAFYAIWDAVRIVKEDLDERG